MENKFQQLRQQAKELGINSFGKSEVVLEKEIASKLNSAPTETKDEIETPKPAKAKVKAKPLTPRRDLADDTQQRARTRAEEIRELRANRNIDMNALDYGLAVSNREPGYEYRWVNDQFGRIHKLESRGWERVENEEPRVVSKKTGLNAFLMRIPQEIYDEDYAAKQKPLDELEEEIIQGNNGKEGESVERNRRKGSATIQRGKKTIRASY